MNQNHKPGLSKGAKVGLFGCLPVVLLGIVLVIAASVGAGKAIEAANPTQAVAPAISTCAAPADAPTPPADGSSVLWNDVTCTWDKIAGTADGVSPAPAAPTTEAAPEFSPQVEQARSSAQSYLEYMGFSHDGLIGQLVFEQYAKADATTAVDSLDVDWNAQAAKSAESYLDTMPYSCKSLVGQLTFEKFTKAQATYGANQTKACK
jgi:hypothetical protein